MTCGLLRCCEYVRYTYGTRTQYVRHTSSTGTKHATTNMTLTHQHRSLLDRLQRDDPAVTVGGLDGPHSMNQAQDSDDDDDGSGFSNFSTLENETDDFGRRILQHQRDLQRIKYAMGPGQQPFRRARPKSSLAERLGQRDQRNDEVEEVKHERTESASNAAVPPVEVPRQWGRRAKKNPNWLRNRHAVELPGAPLMNEARPRQDKKADEDAIMPHRTTYTGDEDWHAAQDEMLPNIQDTSPSMRRHRSHPSPSSMRHMNTTLGQALESEDHDFSSVSLLASTPAVNRRDRKIDELMHNQLEGMRRRGFTKQTLGQALEEAANRDAETRPVTAPAGDIVRISRRRRSLVANKENMAPNGISITNKEGTDKAALTSRQAQAVTFQNRRQPAHARTESYNLLKQLASSMSPSPGQDRSGRNVPERPRTSEPDGGANPSRMKSSSGAYRTGERPLGEVQQRERRAPLTEGAPPSRKGDTARPDGQHAEDADNLLAPVASAAEAQTPVVTGAWVDTPGQRTDSRPLPDSLYGAAASGPRNNAFEDGLRRIRSETSRAKSALSDILKEARDQPDGQFGDTTIQSLENIANPGADLTDTIHNIDIEQVAQEVVDAIEAEQPMTQAVRQRRQEALAMEALNKHHRAAKNSLKNVNGGLPRIGDQIETAQEAHRLPNSISVNDRPQHELMQDAIDKYVRAAQNSLGESDRERRRRDDQTETAKEARPPLTAPPAANTASSRPTNSRNSRPVCGACGGTSQGSVWQALCLEFLSCFYSYSLPHSRRPRPTWLGLLLLASVAWYITESLLCRQFCHKLWAETMIGYGVDPNAPRFPFVIPTLLLRPFKPVWEPVLGNSAWCFDVFGNWVFGDSAVDVDPPFARPAQPVTNLRRAVTSSNGNALWQTSTTAVAAATARVAGSMMDVVDEAGSMWDDEFL